MPSEIATSKPAAYDAQRKTNVPLSASEMLRMSGAGGSPWLAADSGVGGCELNGDGAWFVPGGRDSSARGGACRSAGVWFVPGGRTSSAGGGACGCAGNGGGWVWSAGGIACGSNKG